MGREDQLAEPFRSNGEWWLPDHADRPIAGELSIEHHGQPRLELVHLLTDGHSENRYEIVLGTTLGGEPITLESLWQSGRNSHFSNRLSESIERETLTADWGYRGAHLETADDRTFQDATIDLSDLLIWAGASGFDEDWDRDRNGVSISLRPPEQRVVELPQGRLTLGQGWTTTGDMRRSRGLSRSVGFRIEAAEPVDLQTLLARWGTPLRYLLTFATDRANEIERLSVNTKIYEPHRGTDVEIENPRGVDPREERDSVGEDYLFDADSLGDRFAKVLSTWFELYDRIGPALDLLFGPRYRRRTFVDNHFLNVVAAAESYHRATGRNEVLPRAEHKARKASVYAAAPPEHLAWLKERLAYSNEPTLRERLVELYERAFNVVGGVLGSANDYAAPIVKARNALTHRGERRERIPGRELFKMTEQTAFLMTACLMLDLGFEELEVVEGTRRARRFRVLTEVFGRRIPSRGAGRRIVGR